jgi:hypothetical protein
MPELRFYCFVNYYLSAMQQGIQTGHCAVDVLRKYTKGGLLGSQTPFHKRDMVESWADGYKTFITLNGGNNEGIKEATRIISDADFPWVAFNEDGDSLDGLQTCVGVVLPENIFKAQPIFGDNGVARFEFVENGELLCAGPDHKYFELMKLVTSSGLAR